jgi:putative flippase GtrA
VTGRASEGLEDQVVNITSLPPGRTLRARLLGATGSLGNQFARYLVVGGVAFVIDFGSLYLLTEFAGLHYLTSAAVAFLFGLVTNYWLSRAWVFDRRTAQNVTVEFVVFAMIGVIGLGLNEVIIWFAGEKLYIHYMIAKAFSAGLVLIWNFGARKFLLFR